jgi:hypothetical protein
MYGLHVDLVATTAEDGDILEHLDLVAGQLGEIEDGNEALLDSPSAPTEAPGPSRSMSPLRPPHPRQRWRRGSRGSAQ